MKTKSLLLIFLFAFIIIVSGCFQVERNNPLDPDSGDYDESLTTVKLNGTVTRGYSDIGISDVTVEIYKEAGDYIDTLTTGSEGQFTKELKPGNYQISLSKTGWQNYSKMISVNSVNRNSNQEEIFEMYIWRADFDEIGIGDLPQPPWNYYTICSSSDCSSTVLGTQAPNGDMGFKLSIMDNLPDTGAEASFELQPGIPNIDTRDKIIYAVASITISDSHQNSYFYMELESNAAMPGLFSVYFNPGDGKLFFQDFSAVPTEIATLQPNDFNARLIIELYIDPNNKQTGYLTIYNVNQDYFLCENTYVYLSDSPTIWDQVKKVRFDAINFDFVTSINATFVVWQVMFF